MALTRLTSSPLAPRIVAAALCLGSLATLEGCSRTQDAGDATRSAVAQTEAKATELKNDAAAGLDKAKDATREMAQDAKQSTKEAGAKLSAKAEDIAITTSINAEFAKDSTLSARKIDVDSDSGRVTLQGTAPSASAREHAGSVASSVQGVVSVDNQLTVDAAK